MSYATSDKVSSKPIGVRYNHKDEDLDMTAFHTLCKSNFILFNHGTMEDYKSGERVMRMQDLNLHFINEYGYIFYWNFFDGMYVDVQVAKFIENLMDINNLRFNEKNMDTLEYLYPRLSSRARIAGDEGFAKILRRYQIRNELDSLKLACQVYTATEEFVQEFIPPWAKVRPVDIDTSSADIDCVLVVTRSGIEFISATIRRYARAHGINIDIDEFRPGVLTLTYNNTNEVILSPGDAVNLENGNICLVKYDNDGVILDTLKIRSSV